MFSELKNWTPSKESLLSRNINFSALIFFILIKKPILIVLLKLVYLFESSNLTFQIECVGSNEAYE